MLVGDGVLGADDLAQPLLERAERMARARLRLGGWPVAPGRAGADLGAHFTTIHSSTGVDCR